MKKIGVDLGESDRPTDARLESDRRRFSPQISHRSDEEEEVRPRGFEKQTNDADQ